MGMGTESVSDEIYEMILKDRHITYTPDPDTVTRLKNEAAAGIAYIRKYCNPAADCSPGTTFGQLLCEYVLRAEAGAVETFEEDFAEDITAARIEFEVDRYAGAMGYEKT